VPESWLTTLGIFKEAGASGLLLGLLGVPLIWQGRCYWPDLVLRRCYHQPPARTRLLLSFPFAYLLLTVAVLVLDLATRPGSVEVRLYSDAVLSTIGFAAAGLSAVR
jgi:hypothetical protein